MSSYKHNIKTTILSIRIVYPEVIHKTFLIFFKYLLLAILYIGGADTYVYKADGAIVNPLDDSSAKRLIGKRMAKSGSFLA